MKKTVGHAFVFGSLELDCLDHDPWFVVDRRREELRSLDATGEKLTLLQGQTGRRPDGEMEVLERYATEDGTESIVLDSSPAWLDELKEFDAMFLHHRVK